MKGLLKNFSLIISIIIFFLLIGLNKNIIYGNYNYSKISFKVTDNYNTLLDNIEFLVFDNYDYANQYIKTGTTNFDIETLNSKNNIVISEKEYPFDKSFYIILKENKNNHEKNTEIYRFKLGKNDNYLTEQYTDENNKSFIIKKILSEEIVLENKYKIKLLKRDSYNEKLDYIELYLYSDFNSAEKALAQSLNKENMTTNNLLEILNYTDGLGVTISNNFYSGGTYYIVEKNNNDSRYDFNKEIIQFNIESGERSSNIEEIIQNNIKIFLKKIDSKNLISNNKYKIKIIDTRNVNNKKYYIVKDSDLKIFMEYKNPEFILETIELGKNEFAVSTNYYSEGIYYIINCTEEDFSIKNVSSLSIENQDKLNVEKEIFQENNLNKYYYTKLFSEEDLNLITLSNDDNNLHIPVGIPKKNILKETPIYTVYKNNLYNRYDIFDDKNIPLGYIKYNPNKKIEDYNITNEILPFYIIKNNPSTYSRNFLIYLWVLIFLSFGIYLLNKKIQKKIRYTE